MDVIDKKFVKIKYFFPEFFLVHHHMRRIFLSTGEFAKTLTHTVITGSQRLRHANTQCFEVLARLTSRVGCVIERGSCKFAHGEFGSGLTQQLTKTGKARQKICSFNY